ncbi:MAG: hypothetical protein Q7T45_22735 [Bradyrhizobium sp.]|nr:hypothetical protein [Bradyrhizobium sp.]MDO8400635.1 hypothetical protein [Bradyrhizobium sp.]
MKEQDIRIFVVLPIAFLLFLFAAYTAAAPNWRGAPQPAIAIASLN